MTHANIYKVFQTLFPMYAEKVTDYFPTGKGAIRVRLDGLHQDFIFTYHNGKDWCFETVESFLRKGAK